MQIESHASNDKLKCIGHRLSRYGTDCDPLRTLIGARGETRTHVYWICNPAP